MKKSFLGNIWAGIEFCTLNFLIKVKNTRNVFLSVSFKSIDETHDEKNVKKLSVQYF